MELLPFAPHIEGLFAFSPDKLHMQFFPILKAVVGPLVEVFSAVS